MRKYEKYTQDVRQVISYAREEAQNLRHRLVGTEHLLLGLLHLQNPLIEGVFAALHISSVSISQALHFVMGRSSKAILSEPLLSASARLILTQAEEEAERLHAATVGVEHVFLALLTERNEVTMGVLESLGMHPEHAYEQLVALIKEGHEHTLLSTQYHIRYETTPSLNQVSRDLTIAALDDALDPLIGRAAELERTMQILARRSKNNPVLIGPSGVGKTAIAEGLALRIIQGRVPDHLLHCRVVSLDVGMLSLGTRFRGDFEERLKRVLQEVLDSSGLLIFIDELHTLVQTGVAEGSIDAANLFKPLLARGEFQCIGATTLDEYRKTIEADPALERRFQPVMVAESSQQETLDILRGLRKRYEAFHRVEICDEALEAAVRMSVRYIQHRYLPDKALDLVDEAASYVCMRRFIVPRKIQQLREELIEVQREKEPAITSRQFSLAARLLKRERQVRQTLWQEEQAWRLHCQQQRCIVQVQDVASVVASRTQIPVTHITNEESFRLLHLEEELHQRVIGQDEAVRSLANAVRRARTDIRDTCRPIGSFLFVGPTGVGKTELARALAASLFADEDALFTLDMSEFMESHSAARLVGAPPGYVGYDRAGQLTEIVRRRPYCVLLFDEIEKAHPRVFDLLLQILADGCLTDAQGQKVNFKHTIIILTSNIGSTILFSSTCGFLAPANEQEKLVHMHEQLAPQLRSVFRPELLNRFEEIIAFHPLQPAHLHRIVDLLLEKLRQRLLSQSVELHVTDAVRKLLVTHGYHPEYGARPLRRALQRLLEDVLAEALLRGEYHPGDHVLADVLHDQIVLTVQHESMSLVSGRASEQDHAAA